MVTSTLLRWASWLWPIGRAKRDGKFGLLEVRYEGGRLVLNSAHGNQSFGNLHRVWQMVFDHVGLKDRPPADVLLLGLGGESVPQILGKELGIHARITAVEVDPAMIALAREHFGLEKHALLTVVEGDATVHVHADRQRYDLVVVDLFEDLDLARGVDTLGFAHALRDRTQGVLCFNTVGFNEESSARCDRVRGNLGKVFHTVDELVLEGFNRVFIAR